MSPTSFTMKQLLEAGIHLGHKKHKWNPAMSTYLFGVRNGIHIIDLEQSIFMLRRSANVVTEIVKNRGNILFIGTRNDISNIVTIAAKRCSQPYINHRWVGGTITNWKEVYNSIQDLKAFSQAIESGNKKNYSPSDLRTYKRLKHSFNGIKNLDYLPDLIFILDTNQHRMTLKEANKFNIPTIGVVDSNCNPEGITYPIPGNDDSLEAIYFYCDIIAMLFLNYNHVVRKNSKLIQRRRRGSNPQYKGNYTLV